MNPHPVFAPIKAININNTCFTRDLISPSNKPFSITLNAENVPPNEAAMAHIFIEFATFSMEFIGGWLVIIALIPENTLAPTTMPKDIKKLCTKAEKKEDKFITILYNFLFYKV